MTDEDRALRGLRILGSECPAPDSMQQIAVEVAAVVKCQAARIAALERAKSDLLRQLDEWRCPKCGTFEEARDD